MSNPLQILGGILLIMLLPGWTLVNMVFPRKGELDPEYDAVYRLTLGMGVSIVIAILVGFLLNALSSPDNGLVRAGPLWIVLGSLTAGFLVVGWYRGAYPVAGFIHPRLYRRPLSVRREGRVILDFRQRRTLDKLVLERERLLKDIRAFAERSANSNPQRKLYYRKRTEQAMDRIDQINDQLKRLGKGGA
jgi:hypothetical protein